MGLQERRRIVRRDLCARGGLRIVRDGDVGLGSCCCCLAGHSMHEDVNGARSKPPCVGGPAWGALREGPCVDLPIPAPLFFYLVDALAQSQPCLENTGKNEVVNPK